MKPKYILLALIVFSLSCKHNQASSIKKDSVFVKQHAPIMLIKARPDTDNTPIDTTKELLSYNYSHLFSDTSQKDNFRIKLLGTSITHGLIVFEISTFNKHPIFREEFPSSDLLADMADVLNKEQQADTIKARMVDFFNKNSFSSPAISLNDKYDIDDSDEDFRSNWNDIKSDQTAVAFFYSHGYESTFGIAYSKKQKKVVSMFYSD